MNIYPTNMRVVEVKGEFLMKKILVIVVAFVLVFAFSITASASSRNFTTTRVFGGISQELVTNSRVSSGMSLSVSSVTWNGQSGWKIRCYSHLDGSVISNLVNVTNTGSYYSTYTSLPFVVTVKTSISSGVSTDYLQFSGYIDL